jgi:hypothetical protein
MIVGNISMRGSADKRKETKEVLTGLVGNKGFFDKMGVVVDEVLSTFGWSDFNVRVYGVNAEAIKISVIVLRDLISSIVGDKFLETSTIIGIPITDSCDLISGKDDFLKKYKTSMMRTEEGFIPTPSIQKELKEKLDSYISKMDINQIF